MRTCEAVRQMAYDVWAFTLKSKFSGTKTEKQRLINEGMEKIIRAALGDYDKEILKSSRAAFRVEMKDGNRIKDAYQKGVRKPMSPDSCIIPTWSDGGNDFVLMYKMNMSSVVKNRENTNLNRSGEMMEFHENVGNRNKQLVMMNATPRTCFKPTTKKDGIRPEKVLFDDHEERFVLNEGDVPGSLGHRIKTQSTIVDIKFDWDPRVTESMTSKAALRDTLVELGPEAVLTEGMDLYGLDRLVLGMIRSYDPLHELSGQKGLFEDAPEDEGEEFAYPF